MLRRVWPANGGELDTDSPDARATLLDWYTPHDPEYLRLNFVTTLDGRVAGTDGTSESLTSRADRMILGVIRQHADVVLVGAETVRREGYLRPRRAALAIVTASGDLTGHRLDEKRPDQQRPDHNPSAHQRSDRLNQPAAPVDTAALGPVIVLTTATGAERAAAALPWATVLVLPMAEHGRIMPAEIVSTLRSQGYFGIAAEGGPTFATQLVGTSLVDELCVTVIPTLGGPALPLLGQAETPAWPLTARQLLLDDAGAQYGRWDLRRSPS